MTTNNQEQHMDIWILDWQGSDAEGGTAEAFSSLDKALAYAGWGESFEASPVRFFKNQTEAEMPTQTQVIYKVQLDPEPMTYTP